MKPRSAKIAALNMQVPKLFQVFCQDRENAGELAESQFLFGKIQEIVVLAQSNSEFIEFLRLFDGDFLGAVAIIGTIGFFISLIVIVVSIARTWNNIATLRMNQRLVQELLQKGYSVDDIERLAYGGNQWSHRFRKLFQSAKTQLASLVRRKQFENQPVPPYKHSV